MIRDISNIRGVVMPAQRERKTLLIRVARKGGYPSQQNIQNHPCSCIHTHIHAHTHIYRLYMSIYTYMFV